MYYTIIYSAYLFTRLLELIIIIHILLVFAPISKKAKESFQLLVAPFIVPTQRMLDKSILKSNLVDFSPLIVFFFVSYLRDVFHILLQK